MSSVVALPEGLRVHLATAARRIRRGRLLQGAGLLIVTLTLLGGAALLLDAWLDLPRLARILLLTAWVSVGVGVALFGLWRPLRRRLDPEALAAAIEAKYPDLGERLTSTVELANSPDPYHGSPAFVALLARETEIRTRRLDIFRAFPAYRTRWLTGAALLALLAAGVPALFWPADYANRGQRFLFSWQTPVKVVPFALEVTPGSTVTAAGRPLTFGVGLRLLDEKAALPAQCAWVGTDAAGNTVRRLMHAERSDAFTFKLDQVSGDFHYRIEVGEVASPDFQVTAITPVELADSSTTVTPPAYARATVETQTVPGLTDLAALQHSQVHFAFRFNRPAVAAFLEWSAPANVDNKEIQNRQYPLELTAERTAARLQLPAVTQGTFRIVLEAEHGIRTELTPRTLTVKLDQPPAFLQVSGGEELKMVRPYESLPVAVELADDVAVDRAELEYRVNEGQSMFEPIILDGQGTRHATGRHVFHLSGKGKEGDLVRYRVKAQDNRDVPEANLKPQVIYYPPESGGQPRWRTLKIARKAVPLEEQEILAQKEELDKKIDAIQRQLRSERNDLNNLQEITRNEPTLKPEQVKILANVRNQNRAVESDLRELARDAGEVRGLEPVADVAQELADKEMRRGDESLKQAAKAAQAEPRDRSLKDADRELTTAARKLDELRRRNEQMAKARLEQLQLETLANRQEQLARRAAEQAAADPIKDPGSKEKTRGLERDQRELAADLRRETDQREVLKKALDAARAEKANQLAERARELAKAERTLAKDAQDQDQKRHQERLDALARQQRALAERASTLAKDTEAPAQAAKTEPLHSEDARQAADALKRGDAPAAIKAQDQAVKDLERLASDLERAADLAKDPREAARQLARFQENLRKRMNEETRKPDANEPLAERVRKLQGEQRALQRAAQNLSVPENNPEIQKDRKEAVKQAAAAAEALNTGNPRAAEPRMKEASQALERLANRLPSLERRKAQALAELAELRKRQERVARDADQALHEAKREKTAAAQEKLTKRLTEAARQQAEIADRLGKMDAPGGEAQRDQAHKALKHAQEDLKKANPKEIGSSQLAAHQELEQLAGAIAGKKPVPGRAANQNAGAPQGMPNKGQATQARQLAKEQRELRDAVQKAMNAPPSANAESAAEQAKQGELRKDTEGLKQDFNRLVQDLSRNGRAQQSARQAANLSQQARDAMERAGHQGQRGQMPQAYQSQEQAAQNLEQAAQAAEQAGQQMAAQAQSAGKTANAQTGQNLDKAQNLMSQAQQQLGRGQSQGAQVSMREAAQSLRQAVQQLAQGQPTTPAATQVSKLGASGQGRPDPSMFGKELKQYAGKSWGELPGELRTKIIQDVKAKYGKDYARIIKLYFEQLADKK